MAVAKKAASKSTAIVRWDEKFAAYARQAKEQVASIGGGVGIKFGRGSITVGGTTVPGGKLECVVLGYCALNAWYEADYDPNDAQPPDCYAFALINDDPEMKPHSACASPQSELCADCEKNVYGSAKTGRGKACGNNIRLGVLVAKDVEDAASIGAAELAVGKVSPTNLKHWAGYVANLDSEYGRPPWAVVTEISSYEDPKTQIRLEFRMVELIEDNATLEALEKRYLKIQEQLQVPYPAPTEKAKPAARGGKTVSPVKKNTGVGAAAKFTAAGRGKK